MTTHSETLAKQLINSLISILISTLASLALQLLDPCCSNNLLFFLSQVNIAELVARISIEVTWIGKWSKLNETGTRLKYREDCPKESLQLHFSRMKTPKIGASCPKSQSDCLTDHHIDSEILVRWNCRDCPATEAKFGSFGTLRRSPESPKWFANWVTD
jgi:hypothetical protein